LRLKGQALIVLVALTIMVILYATNQVAPAASAHEAQLRIWLAARATGLTALVLLTGQVTLGLVLSHPTNQSTWKLSKRIFPWHENLLVFIVSFLAVHVVFLVLDPYAGVGIGGALIPGLSSYRTVPVAVGVVALYALVITGLTARYPKRLPTGWWLKLHRFSVVVFVGAWFHGVLAGTDSQAFLPAYIALGSVVLAAAAYRYWVVRHTRPAVARPAATNPPARNPVAQAGSTGEVLPTRAAGPTIGGSYR
jgi:DMSO/TMAO reductase YedYZ heme-binding membrane subunit